MISKTLKYVLVTCCLLTLGVGSASATDAHPLYAMLDANTMQGVLNGIAALTNSGMYSDLLLIFGLAGLGWMTLVSSVKRGTGGIIRYLIISALLVNFVIGHKVNVQVIGQMDGKTYEVNNVPGIIAWPASWMSVLGQKGAKLIDTAYASHTKMNADLTMTGGMPFSIMNQIMLDASTYQIRDPYLRSSLIHFIVDCGVPAIANGKLSMTQVIKSNNIWDLFDGSVVNPSLETVNFGTEEAPIPAGSVVTCPEAQDAINKILPKSQNSMVKNLSKGFMSGITAGMFKDAIAYNASSKLYNPTPGSYLQQAAILNLLNGPVQQYMGAKSKSAALMQGFAVGSAVKATESGWETAGMVFAATFGYLYAAMQILIYAVAPILILFALFPGAMKVIFKNYVVLLAWFPLTFIMLAIVNNLILGWGHSSLGNVFSNFGGLVRDSQALITKKASNMQAVGAMLISLTPMLAWMLLKGGQYVMTAILGHSGAERYGQRAAEQEATGNVTTDAVNSHNSNFDKQNLSRGTDIGAMPVTSNVAGAEAMLRVNAGGEQLLRNNAADMMTMNAGQSTDERHGITNSVGQDSGGTVTTSDGFTENADVQQSHSNALSTTVHGGFDAGKMIGATAQAMMAKAAVSGAVLSEATATATATDVVDARMASESAFNAEQAGDTQAAKSFGQQAHHLFSGAMHKLEDTWKGAPWYDKAAIGAVVAAGTVAAFATGVGEVAAAGAAEVGGAALVEAAATEGVAGATEAGIADESAVAETEAGAGAGASKMTKLRRAALGGLAAGLGAGIREEYSGRSDSIVTDRFSSQQQHSGDNKVGYSNSSKADESASFASDSSARSSYQVPNEDFYSALGETKTSTPALSHLQQSQKVFNQQKYKIAHSSQHVQDTINGLHRDSSSWQKKVNGALDKHKGLNQLSKTKLQKNAGNYHVKE